MRVQTRGKFISVCEPNQGRVYDDNGKLIFKSKMDGSNRRTNKRQHVRKLRKEANELCVLNGNRRFMATARLA